MNKYLSLLAVTFLAHPSFAQDAAKPASKQNKQQTVTTPATAAQQGKTNTTPAKKTTVKPGTLGPAPKNPPLKYSKPTPYVPKEPENAPKKTTKPAVKKKPSK